MFLWNIFNEEVIIITSYRLIPDANKPRERLFNYGEEYLSNEELLAIMLKTGTKSNNVKEVALNLLMQIEDIHKLRDIGIASLMKIDGIGKVKAIELKAAIELGRRVYSENKDISKLEFGNPLDVYDYFSSLLENKKQEYFYAVYLDVKNKYIDKRCLFVGTINSTTVHPREIFKEAYLLSASKIICVHNHPSGDVSPSKADIEVTRKIKEIGIIHGILLTDHVIIGNKSYYSFHDNNII